MHMHLDEFCDEPNIFDEINYKMRVVRRNEQ